MGSPLVDAKLLDEDVALVDLGEERLVVLASIKAIPGMPELVEYRLDNCLHWRRLSIGEHAALACRRYMSSSAETDA
jgi:hypothetical protein